MKQSALRRLGFVSDEMGQNHSEEKYHDVDDGRDEGSRLHAPTQNPEGVPGEGEETVLCAGTVGRCDHHLHGPQHLDRRAAAARVVGGEEDDDEDGDEEDRGDDFVGHDDGIVVLDLWEGDRLREHHARAERRIRHAWDDGEVDFEGPSIRRSPGHVDAGADLDRHGEFRVVHASDGHRPRRGIHDETGRSEDGVGDDGGREGEELGELSDASIPLKPIGGSGLDLERHGEKFCVCGNRR